MPRKKKFKLEDLEPIFIGWIIGALFVMSFINPILIVSLIFAILLAKFRLNRILEGRA